MSCDFCDGCEHFRMVPEMGAHLPWCKLYMRYYPKRCDRFETPRLRTRYVEPCARDEWDCWSPIGGNDA